MRGSSCTSTIKGRFAVSGITEEAPGGGGCGRVLIVGSAAAGAMMWLSGCWGEEMYQYYRKCTVRRTHIHEHDLFENQVSMIVTSQYKWSIAPGSFW